jgi:predicted DNA-binding transcriptional regulator YafY
MSKKRAAAAGIPSKTVTLERAIRLHQLVRVLAQEPKTRPALLQRLNVDIRTFYRDLEVLRECRISVRLTKKRYGLEEKIATAVNRLPFPDPNLTLGEAMQLAKGRTPVHRKLARVVKQIMR